MDTCDVAIVGGGPAGSACARTLAAAGCDVLVLDRASFPRDKVCAGWITEGVLEAAGVDAETYAADHVLQPISSFLTGLIDGRYFVETEYSAPVSYAVRRFEFDDYLLRRSGARVRAGHAVRRIERSGNRWVLDETISAAILVGAGGHFCPVAALLNPAGCGAPLVAAQEAEILLDADQDEGSARPGRPEFYFCRDLEGYGWCVRKGRYLNVGLGRTDPQNVPAATAAFERFLRTRTRVPASAAWRCRGHAYLLADSAGRRAAGPGVLLVGDAAGLADARTGEGIGPAITSGVRAGEAILQALAARDPARLGASGGLIVTRSREPRVRRARLRHRLRVAVAPALLGQRWFVRHVVLDRWFLHRDLHAS